MSTPDVRYPMRSTDVRPHAQALTSGDAVATTSATGERVTISGEWFVWNAPSELVPHGYSVLHDLAKPCLEGPCVLDRDFRFDLRKPRERTAAVWGYVIPLAGVAVGGTALACTIACDDGVPRTLSAATLITGGVAVLGVWLYLGLSRHGI